MTTPVVTYESKDQLITGFYVPSKYDINTAPKPSSDDVFLQTLDASVYAVIRFRGRWTEKNFHKHDLMLLEYMNENDLTATSNRLILRYQPPFIPSIFRRNEIAYQILNEF